MTPAKKTSRKHIKSRDSTQVLVRSSRRCPLCLGLNGDSQEKLGQIAHLDDDPSNADPNNLQFLCLAHHAQYGSISNQAKGITESEVRYYASELDNFVATLRRDAWQDSVRRGNATPLPKSVNGVNLAVYQFRIPYYRLVAQFIIGVVADAKVSLEQLREFSRSTSEILFAFDEKVDAFVQELYSRAVHLRSIGQRVDHLLTTGQPLPPGLSEKDAELLTWFSGSVETWRQLVRPFLHLRDDAI